MLGAREPIFQTSILGACRFELNLGAERRESIQPKGVYCGEPILRRVC
jgi:hypothetical protein